MLAFGIEEAYFITDLHTRRLGVPVYV